MASRKAASITWENDWAAARARSLREGKPVLIYFSADLDCGGCVAMDTLTYPDPQVMRLVMEHFIPLRVNVKKCPELMRMYGVSWTPNVAVVGSSGKTYTSRLEGYMTPRDFIARAGVALGRYRFDEGDYDGAHQRWHEVAQRHHGTELGAEALYWLTLAGFTRRQSPAARTS